MFLTLMAVIAVGCVQDRALKQFDYAPGGDDGAGAVEVMDFETMDTGAEKAEVLDLEIEVVCAGGCGEQECGDDGCGGSCGSCPAPANPCHKSDCTAEHMCVESPNDGIDCDDGLWCTVDDECDEGVCVGQLDLDHCLIDGGCYQNGAIKPGNPCAECAPASALDSWSLVPDGYPCGPSAVCLGGLCCTVACGGKECGDDGCGGVCGKCPAEHHCSDGLCFEICTHECAYDGTTKCFGDAVIVCGYYDEDYCLEWGDSLPCPESSTCMDGECVCQPDCEGKECGDNGCGGSCGTCGGEDYCIAGACEATCGNGICDLVESCFTCEADCGCTLFYKDADGDGYGVNQSVCACAPNGIYTADNVLDCNDNNADVNPDVEEDCLTIGMDDNCNGTTNDMDAENCDPWFEDKDSDGFGIGMEVCICEPQSVYTAPNGDDCDDSNGQVFPGKKETCATGYDDNCNEESNEADADGCTPWWVDQDGDGYAGTLICHCEAPGNAEDYPEDCCDADPNAHPDQTKYFSEPVNWCGGFDYNCDGEEASQYSSSCVEPPCSAGWFQPNPDCGMTGNWCLNCSGCGSCIGQTILQKQKCR